MSNQEITSKKDQYIKITMNVKQFALCGMLAPIVFVVALTVFSMMTPGYSNLTNAVSELGVI